MSDVSFRQLIRDWWREHLEGEEDVDLPALTNQAVEDLLQVPEFRDRFLQESVRPVVYNVGIGFVNSRRRSALGGGMRLLTPEDIEGILEQGSRWTKWLEFDPLSGKHTLLIKMEKKQLLASAKARRERTMPELKIAGLMELIAGRLSDGEVVGDKWTEAMLDDLEQRIVVGRSEISLGPVGTIALQEAS